MQNAHRDYTAIRAARVNTFMLGALMRLATSHGAIDLAVGAPDAFAPNPIKEAAVRAIRADMNQYTNTWGAPRLRAAIAATLQQQRGELDVRVHGEDDRPRDEERAHRPRNDLRHRPPEREPGKQHEHGAEREADVLDHLINVAALPDERNRIPSR